MGTEHQGVTTGQLNRENRINDFSTPDQAEKPPSTRVLIRINKLNNLLNA